MRSIIDWLFASRKSAKLKAPPAHPVETRQPTDAEVSAVSRGLEQLMSAGVNLAERYTGMSLRDVAIEMLSTAPFLAEITAADERADRPTLAYFVLTQLRDEDNAPLFRNAILFQDHCYDVADARDYATMIETMIGLTHDAWSVDRVQAQGPRGQALEFGRPVNISFESPSPVAPFSLIHDKDFDWTVIDRLNERVSSRTEERFAAAFDGNATIVFLTPKRIGELERICRVAFYKSPQ